MDMSCEPDDVCMCMWACMHSMHLCMCVCMYVFMDLCIVCMWVGVYVCMYVGM
jgi:hypothetical protein